MTIVPAPRTAAGPHALVFTHDAGAAMLCQINATKVAMLYKLLYVPLLVVML